MGCTVSKSTDVVGNVDEAKGFENHAPTVAEEISPTHANVHSEGNIFTDSFKAESDFENTSSQLDTVTQIDSVVDISPRSDAGKNQNNINQGYFEAQSESSQPNTSKRKHVKVFKGVHVGQQIMCKDEFYSKYTDEKMYRWRNAEILAIEGPDNGRIFIHFIGWAATFDQWIELNTDWHKLAPIGLLTKIQCDKGVDLNDLESKAVINFLYNGENSHGSTTAPSAGESSPITSARKVKPPIASKQYYVGQLVDIQDVFQKKNSKTVCTKWRKAEIKNIEGNILHIHFLNWDSHYDERIDCVADSKRISEYNSMSAGDDRGARQYESHHHLVTSETTRSQHSPREELGSVHSAQMADVPSLHRTESVRTDSFSSASGTAKQFTTPRTARRRSLVAENEEAAAVPVKAAKGKRGGVVTSPSAVYVNIPIANEILLAEKLFVERLERRGFHVVQIEGDGNCLFRAVSHQLYLTEDRHGELRAKCVKHMLLHRRRFEMFCDGNFDEHVKEMRLLGTWGDDLEIRALEEIVDRIICIYSSEMESVEEPTNKNFEEDTLLQNVAPINLTYHGQSHFNSLCDERNPPPLPLRHSTILLRSRVALFEELLQSNSTKNSIDDGHNLNGENDSAKGSADPSRVNAFNSNISNKGTDRSPTNGNHHHHHSHHNSNNGLEKTLSVAPLPILATKKSSNRRALR